MFYFSKKVRLFSQNDVLFLFYFLINPAGTTAIIIAGAPAPTNGVRGVPETYTPTLKSEEEDNATLTVKDAQESNMTNVTPTVSAAIFLIILTHDKTRRRSESFYLLLCTFC